MAAQVPRHVDPSDGAKTAESVVTKNISRRYRFVGYFTNGNDLPCFHIPILLFYAKSQLGMSFSTTILVFYGLGFLTSCFEIPAGSFGDKYGRKLSYLLSVGLLVFGFGIWLFKLPLVFYILGSLLIGIGNAFRSGSVSAIVFEEYSIENCVEEYPTFLARSTSWFYAIRLFGMPLGAYIYTLNSRSPLILTIVVLVICGFLALFISDKNVTPEHHNARSLIKKTFVQIWSSFELKSFCLLVFIAGIFGNAIWRLFQPTYGLLDIDVKYIGWFYSLFSAAGIVGALTLGKIIDRAKLFKMLLLQFALGASVFVIAAFSVNIYTLTFAVVLISVFFPLSEAALVSFIQQKFERYQQATIMSVVSFLFWAGLNIADAFAGLSLWLFGVRGSLISNAIMSIVLFFVALPFVVKNLKIRKAMDREGY